MTPLSRILAERLASGASMPFSSFMAAALYHPEHGYYAGRIERTGRSGDFFTSVSVGPVFGELMAAEFCAAWERMGKPSRFSIIEGGANNGQFAHDVLTWIKDHRPDFLEALSYQIDEPLPVAASRQRGTLAGFVSVVTHDASDPVPHGCYFANELLDAVPCRRVRFADRRWRELHVALDPAGEFIWLEKDPEDAALKRRLDWLGDDFPEGYTTEVAPAVALHIRLAAGRLEQGYLFFADYGYSAPAYYAPHRTTGTLRCYRNHRAHENPFDNIGETDITAHVDFSLAAVTASQCGGEVLAFLDQSRFLTGAAATVLRAMEHSGRATEKSWQRQFQTLTHPAHLGQKFHFLVLGKNTAHLPLPGSLRFARPRAVVDLLEPDFSPTDES